MPKPAGLAKTRKAVAKRFKVTGSGRVVRNKPGRRHLLQCKNRKRKRGLRKDAVLSPADEPRVKENLPFL